MSAARILYVEDDAFVRESVVAALHFEGFQVTAVGSAEDALSALQRDRYALVLTDYVLPGENGAWFLKQADAAGLIDRSRAIVLSGERFPPGVEGYKFLRKPVEFDALIEAIDAVIGARSRRDRLGDPLDDEVHVAFTLYVTGRSHASQRAIRNIDRCIARHAVTRVRCDVIDILDATKDASIGQRLEDDRVIVTPTLVRRLPAPTMWIVGDLSDPAMLDELVTDRRGQSRRSTPSEAPEVGRAWDRQ